MYDVTIHENISTKNTTVFGRKKDKTSLGVFVDHTPYFIHLSSMNDIPISNCRGVAGDTVMFRGCAGTCVCVCVCVCGVCVYL